MPGAARNKRERDPARGRPKRCESGRTPVALAASRALLHENNCVYRAHRLHLPGTGGRGRRQSRSLHSFTPPPQAGFQLRRSQSATRPRSGFPGLSGAGLPFSDAYQPGDHREQEEVHEMVHDIAMLGALVIAVAAVVTLMELVHEIHRRRSAASAWAQAEESRAAAPQDQRRSPRSQPRSPRDQPRGVHRGNSPGGERGQRGAPSARRPGRCHCYPSNP